MGEITLLHGIALLLELLLDSRQIDGIPYDHGVGGHIETTGLMGQDLPARVAQVTLVRNDASRAGLVFMLFSALAQCERRSIQERTRAGLAAARKVLRLRASLLPPTPIAVCRSMYGGLGIAGVLPGSDWPSPRPLPAGALPNKMWIYLIIWAISDSAQKSREKVYNIVFSLGADYFGDFSRIYLITGGLKKSNAD
jgi:hypothetical protein